MTAPAVQIAASTPDAIAELHDDLAEHRITKAERRIAKVERDLADPKHRAAAYRRLVLKSNLPSNVARLLCGLTEEFGARLENCFPGRKKMREKLGAWAKEHSTHLLTKWLSTAVAAGWLERVSLTEAEDSELIEAGANGRFISATGLVFHVPAGVVAPGHPGVPGPRVWSRRLYGRRRTA